MRKWVVIILLVGIVSGAGIFYLISKPEQRAVFADVTQVLSDGPISENFDKAVHPRSFNFPGDFGPHNTFQTEWWYFTGNLNSEGGRPFGYQLTFFRQAIGKQNTSHSRWRTNQLYMAHFAISDIKQGEFYTFERFSRDSLGLSGAKAQPFKVWLENWEVAETRGGNWMLRAREQKIDIQLTLTQLKPLIFNGQDGLSQKGPEEGNSSYYYSNTRIRSKGHIGIADETYSVSGFSWLDREWSTSALSRNQTGWDWFSIQLDDWREIMFFQIRKEDGGISEFSSGSFVDRDGIRLHLKKSDVEIAVVDYWRSPATDKRYPSAWNIRIPTKNLEFFMEPLQKNQEHHHRFAYWEGAVQVRGDGISGKGYAELTGYSQ
ncbi:MAG: carotenoid 1,2-hydratase [Deltaproteobacteria bacterium]|jgi:predicted secreted hydrolase|nr:carotenoid 1,2-hydratase [Deltaproteobacteria bacterium]MBT4264806.1 carotenoid 1,2-hydratase [Deltaproteobacteria bacterium]MBT4639774.1 carotenoid 1,2-hydratase [Deltaproteobacteria bacterium]MBT6615991.1 carotenoid 1,2-hydratase [Deltaproteobacteria bacterium]MBT7153119.1 carotenoid 1,2-hydratase [Deltaproteobacteria bacterium]